MCMPVGEVMSLLIGKELQGITLKIVSDKIHLKKKMILCVWHLSTRRLIKASMRGHAGLLPLYSDRDTQGLTLHIILCVCFPDAIKTKKLSA